MMKEDRRLRGIGIVLFVASTLLLVSQPRSVYAQRLHIHHMHVQGDSLMLYGQFGSTKGVVVTDSTVQEPLLWSDNLIVTNATDGYAIRAAVGGDTSNMRWLTRWAIRASFDMIYRGDPGTSVWISISFYEVGDISSYLLEPDMPRKAQFGNLHIIPGEHYDFNNRELTVYVKDTGLLQLEHSSAQIDPKQPISYIVRNVSGGISQQNPPPDSVLHGMPMSLVSSSSTTRSTRSAFVVDKGHRFSLQCESMNCSAVLYDLSGKQTSAQPERQGTNLILATERLPAGLYSIVSEDSYGIERRLLLVRP